MFKKLEKRYRYSIVLLRELVVTDFRLRYQGSVLGYVWSLLRPLALFGILYVVFAKFLHIGDAVPYFPIYLLTGIILWNYFIEVASGSVTAIVDRGELLRKINFPKYVIVLSSSFSALINLMLNFVVVAIFLAINHVDIRSAIIFLPLLILELFIFSLAMAFFLSTAYVRFRDVNYIWEVIVQAAFYATPIIYPLSLVPDNVAKILLLNPMAQIIQDVRYVMITPATQTITQLYHNSLIRIIPFSLTLLLVAVAAYYFKTRSKSFAEEV